jgi:hypothetical protein
MDAFNFGDYYQMFLAGVLGWTFAYTFVVRRRLTKLESTLSNSGE